MRNRLGVTPLLSLPHAPLLAPHIVSRLHVRTWSACARHRRWFWLLFDSDLTPAGKNLLDGRYACFGYTTENARLLAGVKEGDVIVSAKVTDGLNRLLNK